MTLLKEPHRLRILDIRGQQGIVETIIYKWEGRCEVISSHPLPDLDRYLDKVAHFLDLEGYGEYAEMLGNVKEVIVCV